MRVLFSMALLAFALLYAGYGFYSLELIDISGRLGPGFFPAIIGVLLIVATAANCVQEYRKQKDVATQNRDFRRDVVEVTGLIALFLLLLPYLGSLLTILVFVGLYLYRFNTGRGWFNSLYAVTFSFVVFVLFEVVLKVGLPKGVLAPLY